MKITRSCALRAGIRGFTLVEMMVAIAVFGIMMLLLTQVIESTSRSILQVQNNIAADNQARAVFDCMQRDFQGMPDRADVDVILYKPTSAAWVNDSVYFFSRTSVYFDGTSFTSTNKNGVSLVGYRINAQSTGNNGLTYYGLSSYGKFERLGKALAWEDATFPNFMPFVGYPTSSSWAAVPGTTIAGLGFKGTDGKTTVGSLEQSFTDGLDSDYQVAASRVFRMELSYLLKDGTQSNIPIENPNHGGTTVQDNLSANRAPKTTDDSSVSYGAGSRWYDTTAQIGYVCTNSTVGLAVWAQIGVTDLESIVVTIAILPASTESNPVNAQTSILPQAPNLDLAVLATAFPKAGNNPYGSYSDLAGNVVTNWMNVVSSAANGSAPITGLPSSIAGGIHVYQRYMPLQN